jgi:hypothetical protein
MSLLLDSMVSWITLRDMNTSDNNTRPTPETDALANKRIGMWKHNLPADHARKLERERDEAREIVLNLQAIMKLTP